MIKSGTSLDSAVTLHLWRRCPAAGVRGLRHDSSSRRSLPHLDLELQREKQRRQHRSAASGLSLPMISRLVGAEDLVPARHLLQDIVDVSHEDLEEDQGALIQDVLRMR